MENEGKRRFLIMKKVKWIEGESGIVGRDNCTIQEM